MEVQTSRLYFKYVNKFQFFIGYNFDTTRRTSIEKTMLKTVTAKYIQTWFLFGMDFITFYQRNASQLEWSLRKFHSPYCQASNGKRIKAIAKLLGFLISLLPGKLKIVIYIFI